jgi:GTP pyrophosphokinase
MYVNPIGFVELRKRVEDLYKSHEQELEEVLCFTWKPFISD